MMPAKSSDIPEQGPSSLGFGVGLSAGLVLAYVAAVGPAAWVHDKVPATRPALEAVYTPVIYACRFPPVRDVLIRYVQLWIQM